MHLLLPPSEGKTAGGRGKPLEAQRAADGPLSDARKRVLSALDELLRGDAAVAARALLLPPTVVGEALVTNFVVRTSPTAPALRRYSGVVYDGLNFPALSPAAAKLAGRRVLVFSGLLGVVRGDEPVPDYRLPAKANLPGIGVAGTFWRPVLNEVLPDRLHRGVVLDLRSSDYAGMWRPSRALAERVVRTRILSRTPSGKYAVVSYNSKFAKGRLAAALLEREARGTNVSSIDDLAEAWSTIGPHAEIVNPGELVLYTD